MITVQKNGQNAGEANKSSNGYQQKTGMELASGSMPEVKLHVTKAKGRERSTGEALFACYDQDNQGDPTAAESTNASDSMSNDKVEKDEAKAQPLPITQPKAEIASGEKTATTKSRRP